MGLGGDDYIDSGAGNDFVDGGSGFDRLTGGEGNDTIRGLGGDDNIFGGSGNDLLDGGDGSNDRACLVPAFGGAMQRVLNYAHPDCSFGQAVGQNERPGQRLPRIGLDV